MAAQLLLVKSKLLLPRTEVAEDADPPRSRRRPARRAGPAAARVPEVPRRGRGAGAPGHPRPDRLRAPRAGAERPRQRRGPRGARRRLGLQAHRGAGPGARQRQARDRPRGGDRPPLHHRRHQPRGRGAPRRAARLLRGAAGRSAGERRHTRATCSRPSWPSWRWPSSGCCGSSRPRLDEAGAGAEIIVEARDTLGDDTRPRGRRTTDDPEPTIAPPPRAGRAPEAPAPPPSPEELAGPAGRPRRPRADPSLDEVEPAA